MAFLPGYNDPTLYGKGIVAVAMRITHDDPSGTYSLPVPENCQVLDIQTEVTEAFDATSVAGTLGDGDDADGYADSTDLALTTASSATAPKIKSIRDLGQPYAKGKRYATADTIDLAWTKGTTGTTGALNVVAYLVNVRNLGIPGGAASSADT